MSYTAEMKAVETIWELHTPNAVVTPCSTICTLSHQPWLLQCPWP